MERRRIPWLSFWRIRLLSSSDVEGLDGDELWETVLNQTMKSGQGKFGSDVLFKCVMHVIVKRKIAVAFM
ncbi:hypothetical protein CPC08DRAFT_716285 [Agrocybe pediades]|nr:hypothetical protein CPC08DRAFT_716285 [Agrocybe pediades]